MRVSGARGDEDGGVDLDALRERYLAAQLGGDRKEALRVILEDGLERGVTVSELADEVIRGAQREIGEKWQRNEIGIADEHMATAISHLVLAQLYERSDRAERNGKCVVVACVEGELHELPARIVADALDRAGFDVRYLGANVPTDSLVRMIESMRPEPDLLALSATMSFHGAALRAAVEKIRAMNLTLPIAVGGAACDWSRDLARSLGVDATASSAAEIVPVVERLLLPPSGASR